MKKLATLFFAIFFLLSVSGCAPNKTSTDILATTAPVYEFTTLLCQGSNLKIDCLITENISCLHDYTLQTRQMRSIESAQMVVISGAGLEDSFSEVLSIAKSVVDASAGIQFITLDNDDSHHEHDHEHKHEHDPHIWLSPKNAKIMVDNIFNALCVAYPQYKDLFVNNHNALIGELDKLSAYAEEQLRSISSREIITFHDGFGYLADAFDLRILHAIEEESGREASAAELIHLCELIEEHNIRCIFTEVNGSVSAAQIIAAETKVQISQLDMAMSMDGYFRAMYNNIDCLKEALG